MTSILESIENEARIKTLIAARRKNEPSTNTERPISNRAIQYGGPRSEMGKSERNTQPRFTQQYSGTRAQWQQPIAMQPVYRKPFTITQGEQNYEDSLTEEAKWWRRFPPNGKNLLVMKQ